MALDSCSLVDRGFLGYPFTQNNKRPREANTKERLDWAVVNMRCREKFLVSMITHLFSHASDHRPLVLQTKFDWRTQNRGARAFKFEEAWLLWDECKKMISEAWTKVGSANSGLENTKENIGCYGVELLAWGSYKTHLGAEEIKRIQKQTEELSIREPTKENRAEFLKASKKLDDLLLKQEIYQA